MCLPVCGELFWLYFEYRLVFSLLGLIHIHYTVSLTRICRLFMYSYLQTTQNTVKTMQGAKKWKDHFYFFLEKSDDRMDYFHPSAFPATADYNEALPTSTGESVHRRSTG